MTVDSSDTNRSSASSGTATSPAPEWSGDARRLIDWFDDCPNSIVAFSGGVDSSVVLAAAMQGAATWNASGQRPVKSVTAVTARSPSVATWQIELAESVAKQLGAKHRIVETDEVTLPEYNVNDPSRCFHCKRTLYQTLDQLCRRFGSEHATLVSGTNADDLGDYRPGIAAGDQLGVCKPLAELGLGKQAVRRLAAEFGLPNADLPASPCLASRIAYGVRVTPARLRQVEQAEDYFRSKGFASVRVRLHEGGLARIEVPGDAIAGLADDSFRSQIVARFQEIGFQYITLDLHGFSSGSMNRPLVSLETPEHQLPSNWSISRETP